MTSCNVLSFPKSRRRTRKAAKQATACKVLTFTGTKRFNYDRGEVLAKWQEAMEATVRKLLADVVDGRVTGLFIVRSEGGPRDSKLGIATATGLFYEDAAYTSKTVEYAKSGYIAWAARKEAGHLEGPEPT